MRRVAAVLAWVALVALPLRAVVACTMPDAERAHMAERPAPEASGHHEHGSPDAPLPAEHDRCPDLASCAAAAILVGQALPVLDAPPSENGARTLVGSLDGPVLAVDPPPPKR